MYTHINRYIYIHIYIYIWRVHPGPLGPSVGGRSFPSGLLQATPWHMQPLRRTRAPPTPLGSPNRTGPPPPPAVPLGPGAIREALGAPTAAAAAGSGGGIDWDWDTYQF